MKPIKTDQCNRNYVAPGCHDLPAYNDGASTTIIYEVTAEDIAEMQSNGRFYVTVYAGKSVPPIRVGTDNPIIKHKDGMCLISYESVIFKGAADIKIVWNTIDQAAPARIQIDKATYKRTTIPALPCHIRENKKGDLVICEYEGRAVLVRLDDATKGEEKETIFELPNA